MIFSMDLLADMAPAMLGALAAYVATGSGARAIAWIGRKIRRTPRAPQRGVHVRVTGSVHTGPNVPVVNTGGDIVGRGADSNAEQERGVAD